MNNQVKKYRKINLDMLISATSLTRCSKESHDDYLARITHLHLQHKRIKKIENLEQAGCLKVLYLYDNFIETIENLEFAVHLQYLYLQNNLIKELPTLKMTNLHKIFLDENEIQYVTGLEACQQLEELHVARQRLPPFTSLQFDPNSLKSISYSLKVLNIGGNNIMNLQQFLIFNNLVELHCQDNNIIDIYEIENIVKLRQLRSANFSGNPCCKIKKYRDIVIASANEYNFEKLDDLEIPRHQFVAIKGLSLHRERLGSNPYHDPVSSKNKSGNNALAEDSYQPRSISHFSVNGSNEYN